MRAPRVWLIGLAVAALTAALAPAAGAQQVLRVGTYNGVPGQFTTIQDAVDAAQPGDWVLVAPGDYHEQADHRPVHGPQPADTPAGVVIATPGVTLRGMNRNGVVVDGTKPGAPQCSRAGGDQDFGPLDASGNPLGRNGVLIWKADNVSVENLTACNFLGGSGAAGNEIWWNGGDGSGTIGLHGFWGSYLNGTSTFFNGEGNAAAYAIFSSNAVDGTWDQTYVSNMNDSGYYVGACQQLCDTTLEHGWSEYNALGYSGTNAGGQLVVKDSEFDNNEDGFDTNSQNNSDFPAPQDGACPNGGVSPITHTHSCWVFMDNYVHDNNNPNVPASGAAAAGPVGTGVSISGGRDDTVMNNRFVHNGAWGVIFVPYPDTETPPSNATPCGGGINAQAICLFDDWGNALVGNSFSGNGFYGNDTNGDFAEITTTAAPSNCFSGNTDSSGDVTSSPAGLQQSKPTCGGTAPPDPNPSFTSQVLCDSQFLNGSAPGVNSTPCLPGANYPRRTQVVMHPLPDGLPTMAEPCAGVPANPWCSGHVTTLKACVSSRVVRVRAPLARRERLLSFSARVVGSGRTFRSRGRLLAVPLGAGRTRVVFSERVRVRGRVERFSFTRVYRGCV